MAYRKYVMWRLKSALHQNRSFATKASEKRYVEVREYLASRKELSSIAPSLELEIQQVAKNPEQYYLISSRTARRIADLIAPRLLDSPMVLEGNPGLCRLTEALLEAKVPRIRMCELSSHYTPWIDDILKRYPSRSEYLKSDLFAMYRLLWRDRRIGTTKAADLLTGIEAVPWGRQHCAAIVGPLATLQFISHLIYCVLQQKHIMTLGRPDCYLFMPSHNYDYIMTDKFLPRYPPRMMLFQLLFDTEVLGKFSSGDFLPWISNKKFTSKRDDGLVYIVNIKPKITLPCNIDKLLALQIFFSSQVIKNNNRIIPTLERWIPGCGVWLITGQDPPNYNVTNIPDENDEPLPHINIFTLFGDLSPKQKLCIFKKFVLWPGYECSAFVDILNTTVNEGDDDEDENENKS